MKLLPHKCAVALSPEINPLLNVSVEGLTIEYKAAARLKIPEGGCLMVRHGLSIPHDLTVLFETLDYGFELDLLEHEPFLYVEPCKDVEFKSDDTLITLTLQPEVVSEIII